MCDKFSLKFGIENNLIERNQEIMTLVHGELFEIIQESSKA